MSAIEIIGAINALTQLTATFVPLAQQAIAVSNSTDVAQIRSALVDLQSANDAMFVQVQQQLRDAGQAG